MSEQFVITEANRPYAPRGGAIEIMYAREAEVVLSGPAGTGKSRANLEKLYACAIKYPCMRGLIFRKTRESLTETGLVTWEEKVVPKGDPCLIGPQRRLRQSYQFGNGSEIVVGGFGESKRVAKVMSSEYDIIFVQEAIELTDGEWEDLTTRCRNGKMPYQQVIADCNPGPPRHWLKLRCDAGKTKLIESRHEDNPRLWNAKDGRWTKEGEAYIAKLDSLTGARKLRLRHGRWAQAEGVVYENWDAQRNLVQRRDIPTNWTRYLSIDFGFKNPFVCQWWAEDPDGRLWRYREIYHTGRLVEDHARQIAALLKGEPKPRLVICDHDAEDRATLERYLKVPTTAAIKDVTPGLQEVESRLRPEADGKPRLFFLRDSLVERDPELAASARPCCTEEEFDGYVWEEAGGRRKGEEPKKENDHGMDATRYLVMTIAGRPRGRWKDVSFAPDGDGSILDELPEGVFGAV